MNNKVARCKIYILIIGVLLVFFLPRQFVYAIGTGVTYGAPQNVRAIRNSNTSVRISWKTDADMDGYIIYRYDRSSKKYVKVKTVRNPSADRWIDRKLKTNKVYRYKVASYKMTGGKKQVSTLSDWVSARTYKRYSKSVNA
ncbi:MAG: fibronectin type III domain-containing protein, partial [Lachnospiraceae bacterium]|nr:fibronectin type III domain-containing protein [Lachnospiraceae bacterium]